MQDKTKISKEKFLATLNEVKSKMLSNNEVKGERLTNVFKYSMEHLPDDLCETLVEFIKVNAFLFEITLQSHEDIQILEGFVASLDIVELKDINIIGKKITINRLERITVVSDLKRKADTEESELDPRGGEKKSRIAEQRTNPTVPAAVEKIDLDARPHPDSTVTNSPDLFNNDERHLHCGDAIVLHHAICQGDYDLVQRELGGITTEKKVELLTAYCDGGDEYSGATAARLAVLSGKPNILLLLLREGFPPTHCSMSANSFLCDIIICELELDSLIGYVYREISRLESGQRIWNDLIAKSFTLEYKDYSVLDVACIKMHEAPEDKKSLFRLAILDLINYGAKSHILPKSHDIDPDHYQGKNQAVAVSGLTILIVSEHTKRKRNKDFDFSQEEEEVEQALTLSGQETFRRNSSGYPRFFPSSNNSSSSGPTVSQLDWLPRNTGSHESENYESESQDPELAEALILSLLESPEPVEKTELTTKRESDLENSEVFPEARVHIKDKSESAVDERISAAKWLTMLVTPESDDHGTTAPAASDDIPPVNSYRPK